MNPNIVSSLDFLSNKNDTHEHTYADDIICIEILFAVYGDWIE